MNTYPIKVDRKKRVSVCAAERSVKGAAALMLTLVFFTMLLVFPSVSKNAVKNALTVCAITLIPSLFPFMVAGELFFAFGAEKGFSGAIGAPFERLFKISGCGAAAFFLGAVCGLPLGGKYALMLYKNGSISRDECQRLMGIATNAGMGFVVMGIGYSVWESAAFGWCLYICQIIASIISGIILSKGKSIPLQSISIAPTTPKDSEKSIPDAITDAISSSALGMLKICAFTVFFAVLSSFISVWCELLSLPRLFSCTMLSFTEITLACSELRGFFLSGAKSALHGAKILTFFAVGFSGMSVHFQLASFSAKYGVSLRRYYLTKLLSGVICAFLGAIVMLALDI